MSKVEVFANPRVSHEESVGRASSCLGRTLEASAVTLRHATAAISDSRGEQLHLYAATQPGVADLVVLSDFPLLYNNAFTAAWLGAFLADSDNGALWIEGLGGNNPTRKSPQLDEQSAHRYWPSARFTQSGACLKIEATQGMRADLDNLPSIYRAMHNGFGSFRAQYLSAMGAGGDDVDAAQSAEATWKYSMFGANQKSFITNSMLRDFGLQGSRRGIDIGGGYGFFAAEMAKGGDAFTVVDQDQSKTDTVGPWLAARAGLVGQLEFLTDTIEGVPDLPGHGSFDVVTYFGSLLYSDRATVPATLRASIELLRPGGILVLHENVRDGKKPGAADYEVMFTANELRDLVHAYAGEPICYSMFSAKPIPWEQAAKSLVMAAIQKS